MLKKFKKLSFLRKAEFILGPLAGYLVFNARFPYPEYPNQLNLTFIHGFIINYTTLIGISLIALHVLADLYDLFISKQHRIIQLEHLSGLEALTAEDEREQTVKYEAGYVAYMTLTSVLQSATIIVGILALVLSIVPLSFFWTILFISSFGSFIYSKELAKRGINLEEKLKKDLGKA
jgi:hypothetical protein